MSLNVLVTGTNSGFGRLTAIALAQRGHQVFATMRDLHGRNRDAAEALRESGPVAQSNAIGGICVFEMEVTSDKSVDEAVAAVLKQAGHLDVVVNNAGFSTVGIEETVTSEQIQRLFDVNVVGSHRVTRAVLPSMKARGKGGLIVQISSALGRIVIPFMGAYCASKAAVESLFESYRYELRPTGIECTIVEPGAFPTEFTKNGTIGQDQDRAKGYGPLENGLQQMFAGLEQMLSGPNAPNPQLVADAIVKLVETPAGARPARVVVDPMTGQATEGLNHAHHEVQKAMLGGMGMGGLVG
jgi:NAD(P)-dependent dehydrogenase (short-subunit alcohol dehydrogenase family)